MTPSRARARGRDSAVNRVDERERERAVQLQRPVLVLHDLHQRTQRARFSPRRGTDAL